MRLLLPGQSQHELVPHGRKMIWLANFDFFSAFLKSDELTGGENIR
jgi:hypothetical protein